eukprot:TRINITY_DN19391_c0_g1_i1.p1 TRINITY_DN19391_c0_g1~~TRINITY_DN19391_c0_g1_i1.p1  ORF type:complete len:192 (+),score=70.18 TRINITY_DN19391_c0_g1_i1:79-576(+)
MADAGDADQKRFTEEEFREAFALFDRRGDDTVDLADIGHVMHALGLCPTGTHVQTLAEKKQLEGEEQVTLREFLHLMLTDCTLDESAAQQAESTRAQLERAFQLWDHEGTGFIADDPKQSDGPLAGLKKALQAEGMDPQEVERLIAKATYPQGVDYMELCEALSC